MCGGGTGGDDISHYGLPLFYLPPQFVVRHPPPYSLISVSPFFQVPRP